MRDANAVLPPDHPDLVRGPYGPPPLGLATVTHPPLGRAATDESSPPADAAPSPDEPAPFAEPTGDEPKPDESDGVPGDAPSHDRGVLQTIRDEALALEQKVEHLLDHTDPQA